MNLFKICLKVLILILIFQNPVLSIARAHRAQNLAFKLYLQAFLCRGKKTSFFHYFTEAKMFSDIRIVRL